MKIKYIFWDDNTGYGISARLLIKSLSKAGIPVLPIGLKQSKINPLEYQIPDTTRESIPYDIVFIHTSPFYISRYLEPGKINVVYCTWETTCLPQKWVHEVNKCNAVFVPSTFNKKCFEQSGVIRPVYILPHISEFKGTVNDSTFIRLNTSDFTFYSIGMWTNRKNNLALINAFTKAFPNGERVRLVIKTSKKEYTKPAFDLFKKWGYTYYFNLNQVSKINRTVKADPRILLISEKWSSEQIAQLHFSADCYISLCKSEGWGLGAYEASWFGKPIIITGFGGQLDFLPDNQAILLPYNLIKIKDLVWTDYNEESQEWAEADLASVIAAMREVYTNQLKYTDQGKSLKQFVSDRFNDRNIIESFIQNLQPYLDSK